jgi:hypothetical protein
MMAGVMFILFHPSSFWLHVVILETINVFTSKRKEGWTMIKKTLNEFPSLFQRIKRNAVISWEVYFPYRQSLLKSL